MQLACFVKYSVLRSYLVRVIYVNVRLGPCWGPDTRHRARPGMWCRRLTIIRLRPHVVYPKIAL